MDKPNPIDVQVGSRVRLRRNMLGLSQEKLGEAIGISFQQMQKYERGANRIAVSRLHMLMRSRMPPCVAASWSLQEPLPVSPMR